jgi:hypothetical protein
MKLKVSLSMNAGQKRRMRERRVDMIDGDHLATTPAKVTRAFNALKHKRKLRRGKINIGKPTQEGAYQPDDFKVKEIVSLSHDVIFNPGTQTTRYSASHEAKRNLERRMPGYAIDVLYGSGEGMLRFYARANIIVASPTEGQERDVAISAECVASATDMAIHKAEIICDGRVFDIQPADKAVFPEEAVKILSKIAENVINNM